MNTPAPQIYAGLSITNLPPIASGTLTIWQLFDIGDAIDLDRAEACLAASATPRSLPASVRQSSSIQIADPPVWVDLGVISTAVGGLVVEGRLRASMYNLGAVALALILTLPQFTGWDAVAELIQPAIRHPAHTPLVEHYCALMVEQLAEPTNTAALAGHPRVQAGLFGERRLLSPDATAMVARLSYYPDDLALVSWNGALLIDTDPGVAATTADLIEFACIERLSLHSCDTALDSDLAQLYSRIAAARRRFALPLARRYSRLLSDVQQLVIEVAEVTERIDNALKVTDDVCRNRLYGMVLQVLQVQVWRAGVEHKLGLLRETYGMLHDASDAEGATALEATIVVLILIELLLGLLRS
jgi:hypothetical protein